MYGMLVIIVSIVLVPHCGFKFIVHDHTLAGTVLCSAVYYTYLILVWKFIGSCLETIIKVPCLEA